MKSDKEKIIALEKENKQQKELLSEQNSVLARMGDDLEKGLSEDRRLLDKNKIAYLERCKKEADETIKQLHARIKEQEEQLDSAWEKIDSSWQQMMGDDL